MATPTRSQLVGMNVLERFFCSQTFIEFFFFRKKRLRYPLRGADLLFLRYGRFVTRAQSGSTAPPRCSRAADLIAGQFI